LGLMLADANEAAYEYSAALLERELGVSPMIGDGDLSFFKEAESLGPGLIGVIEHLMDGIGGAAVPGAPDALLRSVAASHAVVFRSIGRHHRYVRRLDEHLRRIGWAEPALDLIVLGPGGGSAEPFCSRRLVVQVVGSVVCTAGSGGPKSIGPGAGCVAGDRYLELESHDRVSITLSVSAQAVGRATGAQGPADASFAARRPSVSSATLQHVLTLDELHSQGRLAARGLTVRSHHPGGAFGVAASLADFVSGAVVWSLRPQLMPAVGRLLSGPPVAADEFADLASISCSDGVDALMQLIHAGLCEACTPPEPLI